MGAPKGNKNAEKHGAYANDPERDPADLQVRIDDLAAKIDRLSRYIDLNFDDLEPGDIKGLMALHGQLTSRLGRLQRDLKATQGNAGAGQSKVERIMEEALSRFWAEMEEKSGT